MKEYNKKRRVVVDRYSNTPPFNVKGEKMVSCTQHSRDDSRANLGRPLESQHMRLCDIKRLYAKKDKPNFTSSYNIINSKSADTRSISKKSLKETARRPQVVSPGKQRSTLTTYPSKLNNEEPVKEKPITEYSNTYKISFMSIPSHKLMKKLLKGVTSEHDVNEVCVSVNNNLAGQTDIAESRHNILINKKSTMAKKSKSLYTVTNPDNTKLKAQCTKKTLDSLAKTHVDVDDWYRKNSNLKYSSIFTKSSKTTATRHNTGSPNSKTTLRINAKDSRSKEVPCEPLSMGNKASHPLSDDVLREIDNKHSLKLEKQNSWHKFRNVLHIGRNSATRIRSSRKESRQPSKKERCSVKNCELNDLPSGESSIQTLNLCLLDEDLERKTQMKIKTQSSKSPNVQAGRQLKELLRNLENKASTASRQSPKATKDSSSIAAKSKQKMSSNFSIESLRSYFENASEESVSKINEKLKEQNAEKHEVVKSTLKTFSFEKHFPQIRREDGDNLRSKSVRSLFRNTSSSTNTVASSAVSHIFKPPAGAEECRSEDLLDASVSRCCDVDESRKSNYVRQQVDRLNQMMVSRAEQGKEDSTEDMRRCSDVFPNKHRSKFHMNHGTTGEGCTLVERIKRQVSIYKLANQNEDEEDDWSEGDEYTAHISFPKETRNAMSMLMTKRTDIELQEDQPSNPVSRSQPCRHQEPEGGSGGSKLEVKWIPCPRNLLCNRGVHQGSCSVSRRISWPGIAARVSSTTMSENQM